MEAADGVHVPGNVTQSLESQGSTLGDAGKPLPRGQSTEAQGGDGPIEVAESTTPGSSWNDRQPDVPFTNEPSQVPGSPEQPARAVVAESVPPRTPVRKAAAKKKWL